MSKNEILTGTLNADGTVTNQRMIKQQDMRRCPHCIMVADHYHADGTCRCNDPNDPDMPQWGYEWSDELKRWN